MSLQIYNNLGSLVVTFTNRLLVLLMCRRICRLFVKSYGVCVVGLMCKPNLTPNL